MKKKIIRDYGVINASIHDIRVFEEMLDEENGDRGVWSNSHTCQREWRTCFKEGY